MISRTFEIRDASTFIPVLAVKLDPGCEADRYLLSRAGYQSPSEYVWLAKLDGGEWRSTSDPYEWPGGARTMKVAHAYIIQEWNNLKSGDVIDVEWILGESAIIKASEARG